MQTRSNSRGIVIFALLVAGLLALSACSSGGTGGAETAQAQTPSKRDPIPAATTPAGNVTAAYLALQQDLAKDDVVSARKNFAQLATAAQAVSAIADAALRARIAELAGKGGESKDLAVARTTFGALSVAMLDWLRVEPNPLGASLHVAFCPMAFNNAGAKWLQLDGKAYNPYYGSQMLGCGSLDAEVKPGQKLVAK
jgi:membrane fusion protein, copper/silver efflux system